MAKKKHRKKAAYRKNMQNRLSMAMVTLVVVVLLVVVGIRSYGLTQKKVPPTPSQRYSPSGPGSLSSILVRTAKP